MAAWPDRQLTQDFRAMAYRVVLVPVMGDPADQAALALTQAVIGRMRAHVVGLHVRNPIRMAIPGGMFEGAYMSPDILNAMQESGRASATAASERFRGWQQACAMELTSSPSPSAKLTAEWSAVEAPVWAEIGRRGRTADLIVLARSTRQYAPETDEALHGALFASGRPVLIVPGADHADPFGTVIIAWNDSREAAHAVAAAWSLIGRARRIVIFTGGGDETLRNAADGFAAHLAWRGYAPPSIVSDASTDAGNGLLAVAERQNAGLIVMGAYTRSRLRQLVFGGMTSYVLKHATVPLLMAH